MALRPKMSTASWKEGGREGGGGGGGGGRGAEGGREGGREVEREERCIKPLKLNPHVHVHVCHVHWVTSIYMYMLYMYIGLCDIRMAVRSQGSCGSLNHVHVPSVAATVSC